MTPNADFLIYAVHGGFWAAFGVTRVVLNRRERSNGGVDAAPATSETFEVPGARALVAFHALAFGALYLGLGNAVIPGRVPIWFPGQRVVGTLVIAAGAVLASWSLAYFQSWRFQAKLDAGHQLATGGPFAFVRHPIYMGLNLFALGTAVWVPHPIVWAGVVLMVIGSDLRARAEEKLLARAFGEGYRTYCQRTARFIPGIY
jgi:protein-S-isoprenylcysteine O-methyltransferase Ste14